MEHQVNDTDTGTEAFSFIGKLFSSTIGNNISFQSPYGPKNVVYADFIASGRGINEVEEFITSQVLPLYANVHSNCGFLSEQSENFRNEAKTIVRRYVNSDENDSIIFTGQGTTSCVNKLIKLLNLKDYANFYTSLKRLNEVYGRFTQRGISFEDFEYINQEAIDDILIHFHQLFELTNFCYSNRWGSFDCVLCRMTFSQESQYNEHEKQNIHLKNLENCAKVGYFLFGSQVKSELKTCKTGTCQLKSEEKKFIYDLLSSYKRFEPIVFLSLLEHNSNALPWRESGAKVIYIDNGITTCEQLYLNLEYQLKAHSDNFIKIGSFIAASNITGGYHDVDLLSLLMHSHNCLAFFDYATAAPYLKMDMNKPLPEEYRKSLGFKRTFTNEEVTLIFKDALFFSPHKFLGGPNTPGVLVIQQRVVRNLLIPSEPGGGVVLFVTRERENYVKNIEAREESGTPDIIGSVRIGLCLMLREKIEHSKIIEKEMKMNEYIMSRLSKIPNLFILGMDHTGLNRIPIYSFVIKFNGKLMHHNFVSALLNDIFGVQSRPGCSCASTYGQQLLGLEDKYLETLERLVCTGSEIFRPGYTRVNFPYFYPQYIVDYILSSIEFICLHGWKFIPQYAFQIENAKFYHRNEDVKRKWLNSLQIKDNEIIIPTKLFKNNSEDFISEELLNTRIYEAMQLVEDSSMKNLTKQAVGRSKLNLKIMFADNEEYRWFLIYDDIEVLFTDFDFEKVSEILPVMYLEKLNIKFSLEDSLCKITQDEVKKESQIQEDETSSEGILSINFDQQTTSNKSNVDITLFPEIPIKIIHLVGQASKDYDMLKDGDRVLIGLSGGKDSMTLLHVLLYFQKRVPFKFEIAGVTVDPQSCDYNPRPMIGYMQKLGVKYFFESDPIMERAKTSLQNNSICAFCARMKRGIIYNCARREKYNVIALGQHLDDLAESFLMSAFHNGLLRTMKANYIIDQGDLRVIRPLIYCREKLFKEFTQMNNMPVIQENCPACFSAPKERHRMKVLLTQQENIYPSLFSSLLKAMQPLMKGLVPCQGKKDDIDI